MEPPAISDYPIILFTTTFFIKQQIHGFADQRAGHVGAACKFCAAGPAIPYGECLSFNINFATCWAGIFGRLLALDIYPFLLKARTAPH